MVSAKLRPAARTAIRTSPAPTAGSGRSRTSNPSGPPVRVNTTAFMVAIYVWHPPAGAWLYTSTSGAATLYVQSRHKELGRHRGSVQRADGERERIWQSLAGGPRAG